MAERKRQQSERTAATRKAVLEATVELMIERGYGRTSTRLTAERAKVSLGAVQHHFHTKADLSIEALRMASARLAEELVADAPAVEDPVERFAAAIDRLFEIFQGPTFVAAVEIHLASRTDPELQSAVKDLNRGVEELIADSARELLPEMAERPGFEALMKTSVAAIRGLALISMTPDRDPDGEWQMIRDQLLILADSVGAVATETAGLEAAPSS